MELVVWWCWLRKLGMTMLVGRVVVLLCRLEWCWLRRLGMMMLVEQAERRLPCWWPGRPWHQLETCPRGVGL